MKNNFALTSIDEKSISINREKLDFLNYHWLGTQQHVRSDIMLTNSSVRENTNVTISFYKPEYLDALKEFDLPDEQKQFTGMPDESIIKAESDKHRHPIVILAENTPVGFFILYDGEEIESYTSNPNVLLLRAFSINHKEQGKGYAKKGLQQLHRFILESFPNVEEVLLAVNARNIAAKSLYLKCGFLDKGQRRMGKIGMQHVLHFPIEKTADN